MSVTYGEALAKIGVTIPGHLLVDAEVPVLTGPQAQGDLMIFPVESVEAKWVNVPDGGVQVVVGESTGNTHWLHRGFDSPGVKWARLLSGVKIAAILVPEGETAELIHSDEHGCNAIGAGVYVIHGKRERADEIRRVAD